MPPSKIEPLLVVKGSVDDLARRPVVAEQDHPGVRGHRGQQSRQLAVGGLEHRQVAGPAETAGALGALGRRVAAAVVGKPCQGRRRHEVVRRHLPRAVRCVEGKPDEPGPRLAAEPVQRVVDVDRGRVGVVGAGGAAGRAGRGRGVDRPVPGEEIAADRGAEVSGEAVEAARRGVGVVAQTPLAEGGGGVALRNDRRVLQRLGDRALARVEGVLVRVNAGADGVAPRHAGRARRLA